MVKTHYVYLQWKYFGTKPEYLGNVHVVSAIQHLLKLSLTETTYRVSVGSKTSAFIYCVLAISIREAP